MIYTALHKIINIVMHVMQYNTYIPKEDVDVLDTIISLHKTHHEYFTIEEVFLKSKRFDVHCNMRESEGRCLVTLGDYKHVMGRNATKKLMCYIRQHQLQSFNDKCFGVMSEVYDEPKSAGEDSVNNLTIHSEPVYLSDVDLSKLVGKGQFKFHYQDGSSYIGVVNKLPISFKVNGYFYHSNGYLYLDGRDHHKNIISYEEIEEIKPVKESIHDIESLEEKFKYAKKWFRCIELEVDENIKSYNFIDVNRVKYDFYVDLNSGLICGYCWQKS